MSDRVGVSGRVYRNTGTYDVPTWVAINKLSDVQLNFAWETADSSDRTSRVRKVAKTMVGISVTARIKTAWSDPGYQAIYAAAVSPGAAIDLMILDGATTDEGARGLRGMWHVTQRNQNQALGERLYDDVIFTPADRDEQFSAVVVGPGETLTLTAI